MPEQERHTYFLELASKYLSGNASEVEIQELERWVSEATEHRQTFMALKKAWLLTGTQAETSMVDVENWWSKTSAQLFPEAKKIQLKPRTNSRKWLGIAASLAVLLLAAIALYLRPWQQPTLLATNENPQTIQLPDGSQVILNRASTLSVAVDQNKGPRRVRLDGDAFFEVEPDANRPFIVQTNELEIEVLGTSFYVDAREDVAQVQVIVESGRVAVRHQQEERILKAREMAVFEISSNQLDTLIPADDNFRALKTNTLTFDAAKLPEVIFELNRYYRADIRIASEALNDCEFSSTFTDKSLETVLKVLEFSFDLTVTREGSAIFLTGTCDDSE